MSFPTTTDHTAEKNRSYSVRVGKGTRVQTLRDMNASKCDDQFENYEYATVPAGTILEVSSESNAGFRGIEMSARFGEFRVSVSTGAVRIVR